MDKAMAVAGIATWAGPRPAPEVCELKSAAAVRSPLSDVHTVPTALLVEAGDSPRSDGVNLEHVRLLAEVDAPLPPIIVHRRTMRVIDGVHRLRAAALRGADRVAVRFFDGDEQDAFVLAVELNVTHGLPLSAAERSAAAVRILRSHPDWSDRAIAAVAGISAKTVRGLRHVTADAGQVASRLGRDGRIRPVSSAEGRLRAAELMARNPEISLRAVARETGVSPGTVRDVRERLNRGEDVVPPRQRATCETTAAAAQAPVPVPVRPQPAPEPPPVSVRMLVNDPSLRLSRDGRYLLHLLATHQIPEQAGDRLVASVPPHAVAGVSELARRCARAWQEFAERLTDRLRT